MLDFRPKGKGARNYAARSQQWRLMLLVGATAVVMLMMAEARNPQLWRVFGLARQPAAGNDAGAAQGDAAKQPIDTRLPPKARTPLKADEFVAEARDKQPLPAGKKFFPGVNAEFLSEVRDDTVFRSAEADAFHHLLAICQATDEQTLENASVGPVTFTQLFTQPKEFRGELVTIEGTVRRNESLPAVANKYGIKRYAKLVIEPTDRAEPLLAYCVEPPEDLPLGDKLHQSIRLTGFFYKRQAGMAGDGIRTWPLVLAKTVRLVAPAPAVDNQAAPVSPMSAVIVSIVFSLGVVWFVLGRTRTRTSFRIPAAGSPEAARVLARHGLSALKNEEVEPDERERFVRMAEQQERVESGEKGVGSGEWRVENQG
jgi:hypothetical protein